MKLIFCFAIVSLLSCLPAGAQQNANGGSERIQELAPAPPKITPQPTSDRKIVLNVVVTDRSGKPVAGLKQQDFTVLDNKVARKLSSFQAVRNASQANGAGESASGGAGAGDTAAPPLQILLLVDEVNTGFENVSFERQQLKRFLQQAGAHLPAPMSFVFFTDVETRTTGHPSRDPKALLSMLENDDPSLRDLRRSAGFYGAVERWQLSLQTLGSLAEQEATQPGRKLLVWISPGWPILSGPNVQLSEQQGRIIFHTIVQVSAALRQANITLYSVDPLGMADAGGFRTLYYQQFLKGTPDASQAQAGDLALQVLAYQSGGLVLNSSNDVVGELNACVRDANAYYVLSFQGLRADHPDEYHQLHVVVDTPGLKARTRTGYYAQP